MNALLIGGMADGHRMREDHDTKEVLLDHHIFGSHRGWKKCESMSHPTLRLCLSTKGSDYIPFGREHPTILPSYVTAVMETGAQSCLWGVHDFYRCGFRDSDLIPVKRTIVTANQEEMGICGAIMIRLSGVDNDGIKHTAPILVYVTPNIKIFYLSRQALVQLHVIPENFPKVGAATQVSSIYDVASKNPSKLLAVVR